MTLKQLLLQNFRNYSKAIFHFDTTTVIVGKNTAGKTNILEAIHILSLGKSFRAEKEADLIQSNESLARVEGEIEEYKDVKKLAVLLNKKDGLFSKRFLVNNIPRRKIDFVSNFYTVLFTPTDIEIITDSPELRRRFFDSVLITTDKRYRLASGIYDKALRQRNRMLQDIKDEKKQYKESDFEYWENLLIENGEIITKGRGEFIDFINERDKEIFAFSIVYDKSTVTKDRIKRYFETEQKIGITLIGPQRDDFILNFPSSEKKLSEFGSRGEQRLTLLQLKLLETKYLKTRTGVSPVVLLDDIFSELDEENIKKILGLLPKEQTIITTTHKEFIPERILKRENLKIIEL